MTNPNRHQDTALDLLNQFEASDFQDDKKLEQAIEIQRSLSANFYETGAKPERYGEKVPLESLGFPAPAPEISIIKRRLK
jgi:hypothetical protein